jgi:hypothetical protein
VNDPRARRRDRLEMLDRRHLAAAGEKQIHQRPLCRRN